MMIDTSGRRGWVTASCVVVVLMAGSAVAGWWLGRGGIAEVRGGAGAARGDHAEGLDDHGAEAPGEHVEDAPGHDVAGAHSIVHLSVEEAEEFGIEIATTGPGELQLQLGLPGEVVVDPDRLAHIAPRAPGVVRQVEKGLGEDVAAGDVLAWLESENLGEAKGDYLAKRRELGIAHTDLEREQAVHDNTLKLLETLQGRPSLDDLREMGDIEAGENRARLVSAYAKWVLADAVYSREKRLFERKISSEQDFLTAGSDYKEADAAYQALRDTVRFTVWRALLDARRRVEVSDLELKAAERRLHILGLTEEELAGYEGWSRNDERLSWYALRAPFDGTITAKHITLGERLGEEATVFTIADLTTVWALFTIYQKDLASVHVGQDVTIRAGDRREPSRGTVTFVSPLVQEATRTATARVVLENPTGRWRPGMFVTGELMRDRIDVELSVARSALQTMEGQTVVFVRNAEGGFEARPVEVGRSDAELVEIVKGLEVGDSYAVTGAFTLKAEMGKGSLAPGHAH